METLQSFLEAENIQRIGWTLIHFLWQGLVSGIVIAVLLRRTKQSSANVRYRIAILAMYFMISMPLVTFNLVTIDKPGVLENAEIVQLDNNDTKDTEIITEELTIEKRESTIELSTASKSQFELEAVMPYLALSWLAGISILSIWHIGGWMQLQKLRWRTIKPATVTMKSQMESIAEKLGLNKAVNLVESSLVQVPTVVGHFKPMILMPASIIMGISPEQVESLLAHELAHIKRNDYLENIIQTAFETLGFFHPVVWWLSRKIRTERENCCDDLAVKVTGSKLEYAKALAKMEELRSQQYKLAVAATGGNLYGRIRRLLIEEKSSDRKTSGIYTALVTLLVIGVIMPGAFALAANKDKSEELPEIDGAKSYQVNKNVSEFTGPDDFSKPETAYVAINKVMAADDPLGWQRVSIERLTKVFDASRQPNPNTNWANVVTNAKIHGVIINDTKAVVIAEFLQEFSNTKISQPIDARYMELENGKWLNTGEDRFDTIEQAKFKFKKIIDKTNINHGQPKLNSMIEQIDIDNNTREDLLKLFGEPEKYVWGNETFDNDNLPVRYIMVYPNHLHVFIMNNSIVELRIEGPGDYVYNNELKFGSSLDKVIEILGEPDETIVGQPNIFKNKTLYKDIDGENGYCYYAREDKNIRVWFDNNKVSAIYLTRSDYSDGGSGKETYTEGNLPEDSYINEDGHLVDKVDYPFESDPEVIGKWISVDFIGNIEQFNPKRKRWGGELFLKSLKFEPSGIVKVENGPRPFSQKWTKGLLIGTTTASKYEVRFLDGNIYMFYEWKSGDYTIRHMQPSYYVLKKEVPTVDDSKPKISTETRLIYSSEKISLLPETNSEAVIYPDKDVEKLIQYTKNNKESRLVTAPNVTTNDGEEANLSFYTEIVFVEPGKTTSEKKRIDEGVKINITNNIKDNFFVSSLEYEQKYLSNNTTGETTVLSINSKMSLSQEHVILLPNMKFKEGYITVIIKPEIAPAESTDNSSIVQYNPGGRMMGGMAGGMGGIPSGMSGLGEIGTKSEMVGGMGSGFNPNNANVIMHNPFAQNISGPSVKTEVRVATLPNYPDLLKEIMQNPIVDDAKVKEIISLTKKDARSRLITMPYCSTADNIQSDFSFGNTKLFITNHIAADKDMVRFVIEYTHNEPGPDGFTSTNSSATSLSIPSGKTGIISGYNTGDYATLLLVKVTINEAEETATK